MSSIMKGIVGEAMITPEDLQQRLKATGLKLIPIPHGVVTGTGVRNPKTGRMEFKSDKSSYIVDEDDRKIVLVDVNGTAIPFYISTGQGGKETVAPGKWYPFFGIGASGWFNKGTQDLINQYYNSPKLKAIAQKLDSTLGDLRSIDDENIIPRMHDKGQGIPTLNKDLNPVSHGESPWENIKSVIQRIEGKPAGTAPISKSEPTNPSLPSNTAQQFTYQSNDDVLLLQIAELSSTVVDPDTGTVTAWSPETVKRLDAYAQKNPTFLKKLPGSKVVSLKEEEKVMSSIMKGIVDESEEVAVIYIDGKPSAKYAKKHEAERDAEFMRKRHPNKKIEIKHEVRETEAKKGVDGKRCWKGKRYAGTENGKDKCIPVKEESETKWEVAIEYGPTANHTAKIKVSAPDEDTAQTKALALFKKKYPDRRGMVGDCTQIKEAANPAQQAAIAIAKKKKAKTNEGVFDLLKKKPAPRDNMRERLSNMSTDELRQELKDYKSRLSGARASGSLVGAAVSDYVNAIQSELDKRAFNDFTEKNPDWDKGLNEFADDEKSEQPRREHPITIYIYSILHNKTITIVGEKLKRIPYGTYDQVHVEFTVPTSGETRTMWMPVTDKKYPTGALSDNVYLSNSQKSNNTVTDGIFNYWAYEPNVNEGVIVGHDANDPEIAILGGAGTMSLSRLKKKAHQEALQLADDIANGKYSASSYNMKQLHNTLNTIVAAEKEMEKSYFGEARAPHPLLKAANKNLVDLASGEVRRREASRKAAEKGQRAASKYLKSLDKKPSTNEVWRKIENAVANSFPDGDPYDVLWPWLERNGLDNDDVVRAARKQGYKDLWDYWNILSRDIGHEVMNEMPDTSGPVGTQPGGWRRTDIDEYREMSPALKAAQQNLIALRNKEKATSVPGKRERAPRDRVELDKPKPASVLTKGAQEVDPDTMDAIAAFLAKGGEIKKGRPGKAPPTGRQQASKHIGGGGKYRKKSDTPGQGANYRGAAIVAVEEEQLDEKCWTGYKQVGMKKKGGKEVPNCVPKESAIMKGLKR